MYGLSVEEKELFLTKAFSEDVVVTIAVFVVPFGSSKSDVVKLAKEMVAVLNRDLVNRANDIAATPENIATSDQSKDETLWSPDLAFNARNGPLWAADDSGMYKTRENAEQYKKQRWPESSDACGDPACGCGAGAPLTEDEQYDDARANRPSNLLDHEDGPRPTVTQYPMQKNKWTTTLAEALSEDGPVEEAPDFAMDQTGLPDNEDSPEIASVRDLED